MRELVATDHPRGVIAITIVPNAVVLIVDVKGSKIGLFMPGFARVRLGSQAFGVSGSFVQCALA